MKKNILSIIIILLIVCVGSYLIYNLKDEEDKEKPGIRTSSFSIVIDLLENMELEEYKLDEFVFSNVIINANDGNDSFDAILISEKSVDLVNLEFIIYDRDNNKLKSIEFEIENLIEGEERNLFCFVNEDLSGANSFDVKVKND